MEESQRRADMFVGMDDDPRSEPPPRGDERTSITGFLRWQRETFELKCAGLDAEALAARSVEPSTMSLLGLVRHMADVERGWFRRFMAGEDVPRFFPVPDEDFEGVVADADLVDEAWRMWREEVEYAERFTDDAPDLDLVGKRVDHWRGEMSLRWVLLHMIEEYARHLGHIDLLRERIDGRLGQ